MRLFFNLSYPVQQIMQFKFILNKIYLQVESTYLSIYLVDQNVPVTDRVD